VLRKRRKRGGVHHRQERHGKEGWGSGVGTTQAQRRQAAISAALPLGPEIGVAHGPRVEDVGWWLWAGPRAQCHF
jgi:hypothetical protein